MIVLPRSDAAALLPMLAMLTTLGGCGAATPDLRGQPARGVVEAPAPSASHYRTEPSSGPVLGAGDTDAIRAAIERAGRERGVTLRGDGRLALLAAWISEYLGEGGQLPPVELTRFFAHHLGLVETTPHLILLGQGQAGALAQGVEESVARYLERQPYGFYGAALLRREGVTLALVALGDRRVSMRPLARSVPQDPITVEGELVDGLLEPLFVLTAPSGEVVQLPAGAGPAFELRLPVSAPGEHQIELSARSNEGRVTVARFPLFVGVQPPTSIDLSAPVVPRQLPTTESVEASLLALANVARAEAGLPPLEVHSPLADVARRHSDDMAVSGFLAHESPGTGGPADRASAAGIHSGLLLENVGRGLSATDIHRGFMASTGHRGNLLNAEVTHAGVGVTIEGEGERAVFVATQVFIEVRAPIDTAAAAVSILEQVNAARRARSAAPLESDSDMQQAAQRAAELYFADPSRTQQDVVDAASGEARGLPAYRRVAALMALARTADEVARLEQLSDPAARWVGIGVAQGTRPGRPANGLAVVILLGWR